MGYIREPKGVDFFIKSEPLDDEARKEISGFIKTYKARNDVKKTAAVSKKDGKKHEKQVK